MDVGLLARLVSAGEQQDQPLAFAQVVDAVARAVIDPQFGDAVSDGLGVSGVTSGQSIDPDEHPGDRATVLESTEPAVECSGLHHLDHVSTVVHI